MQIFLKRKRSANIDFIDDSSKFWHGNNAENDELFHMFIIFLRKFYVGYKFVILDLHIEN